MKSKKGFTLVELMGVIIILAVLLAIAIPITSNIIKESRKEIFKKSVEGYIRTASIEKYYNNNLTTYEVTDGISNPGLEIEGDISKWNGTLQIYNKKLFKVVMTDGTFCAVSDLGTDKVTVTEGICDDTTIDKNQPVIILSAITENEEKILSKQWTMQNVIISSEIFLVNNTTVEEYQWYKDDEIINGANTSELKVNVIDGNSLDAIYTLKVKVANKYYSSEEFNVKIDKEEPSVVLIAKKATSKTEVTSEMVSNEPLNVSITATAPSGIEKILYCTDTENKCEPNTKYSSEFNHNVQGISYIRYKAINKLGKHSEIKQYIANIDTTIKVAIDYETNGGTSCIGKTVTYNKTYGELCAPTKLGYDFAGWYLTDSYNGEEVLHDTIVTSKVDHTLYAKWTPKKLTLEYDSNGGTSCSNKEIAYASTYGELCQPTREGYDFAGWYLSETDDNGTGVGVQETTTVTTAENHKIYASWTKGNFALTLNKGTGVSAVSATGCTLTSGTTYSCEYGSAVALSATASTGYTTPTWTGGTIIDNVFTMPASATTLTASATAKPIYVYYNSNGGTMASNDAGTWTTDGGFIKLNNVLFRQTINLGGTTGTAGFYDCNNTTYLNVLKTNYFAKKDAEWNTKADGTGTSFDQSVQYDYDTLVKSATDKGDYYRIDLYVNWVSKPIYAYYNVNGGTLLESTYGPYVADSNGFVTKNDSLNKLVINLGGTTGTAGFANYDSSAYINISKTGYIGISGAEWNTKADGTGTSFDQDVEYNYNTLVKSTVDKGDHYRLDLYVNWMPLTLYLFNSGNANGYTWKQGYAYTSSPYPAYFGKVTYNAVGSTTMETTVEDTSTQWGPYGLWYVPVKGEILNRYTKAHSAYTKGGDPTMYIVLYPNEPNTADTSGVTTGEYCNYRVTSYLTLKGGYTASKIYYIGIQTYSTGGMEGTVSSKVTQVYLY